MNRVLRIATGIAATAFLLSGMGQAQQTVTPIPKLELKSFVGTWYEIARFPNKKMKKCVADGVTLFSEKAKAKQFEVVNSCKMADGFSDVRNGDGKMVGKAGDGRLKITYLWPFYTKYWVLAVGPAYEWALVGNPNHKNLAIVSRTSTMTPEVLKSIEGIAAAQGYDLSKLVMITQRR